jgi:tetratricopeptide (TPR) repeat protein
MTVLLAVIPVRSTDISANQGEAVTETAQTADSMLQAADSIFQDHQYDQALREYEKTYERAREEFNRSVEVEALAQIARMHLALNNKEVGRVKLLEAKERAIESDPMGWSRYLGVKGRFEWKDNDLKAATATFAEMFEYCKAQTLWGRAVDAAHMIAIVSATPEEQIEWGKKGIELAEANKQEKWLGPLWNNLAGVFYDLKQFDSALVCYQQARKYHWIYSGEIGKLYADYHVGMTHRLLGQYNEAAKWLRPVLAWAERIENHAVIGQACEDLGEAAIAMGKKSEGLAYLQRARDEFKLEGYDTSWPKIWNHINERIAEVKK